MLVASHRWGRPSGLFVFAAAMLAVLATQLPISRARAADLAAAFAAHDPQSTAIVDHSAWSTLLGRHLKPGGKDGVMQVNYAGFKADKAALGTYLAGLQAVEVGKLNRPEQYAYWINLYNAQTIATVLDHYPVKSIKDISLGGSLASTFSGGPWDAPLVKVAGQELSLNDIEHRILRPTAKDPRIHYAVNCASVGCPSLQSEAFVGARLEAQLDAAARDYIGSPRGVRIASGKATVSSIFKWYKEDFGDNEKSLRKHLAQYASTDLAAELKAAKGGLSYAYDWSLNDTR